MHKREVFPGGFIDDDGNYVPWSSDSTITASKPRITYVLGEPAIHAPLDVEYDPTEQDVLLKVFIDMLRNVTRDGGRKRAAGAKPPWWMDGSHEAALFSHISKWKHDELVDNDSGTHPLVHLAWRALAIAYQESYGKRDPKSYWESTHG